MAVSMTKGVGGGASMRKGGGGGRGGGVTVTGADAVQRMLKDSADRAQDVSPALERATSRLRVRPTHGNRTGALARAMRNPDVEITPDGFQVSIDSPDYAGYVIRGTKRTAAQPPRVNDEQVARDAIAEVEQYVAGGRRR